MAILLDYYNTYGPAGKIYVRCVGAPYDCKVEYHLLLDGEPAQRKKSHGNELIAFLYSSPSIYKIRADVFFEHGEKLNLYSEDIQPVQHDQLSPPKIDIRPSKSLLTLAAGQDNYLMVKFIKGGLKKLENESSALVPIYYKLRHVISFVSSFDKNAIDKIAKYSPELISLRYIYRVEPGISDQLLLELANELQRLDYVEYCDLLGQSGDYPLELEQRVIEPGLPVPANTLTPSFLPLQGYIEAGRGMNVRAVWNRGINGQGINVLIRDTGLFPNHEDLGQIYERSSGTIPDHGTASAGVVMARNNGFGMLGVAFNVNARSYNNLEVGMSQAIMDAHPGSVLTMSLGAVSGNISLPMINDRLRWDQLGRLVSAGVVVVIGAGNGGVDLRNPPFQDHGDNGVILAGACVPTTGRKTWFSNFNHRNFVNSWGTDVATCGIGDLFNAGNLKRGYTNTYSVTSAATPLVAGVLALIHSHARRTYHTIFNNWQMLSIIEQTGYREGVVDMIGVRPNAEAAIAFVDRLFAR